MRRQRAAETALIVRDQLERLIENGPAVVFSGKAEEGWPLFFISPNLRSLLGYEPRACLQNPRWWSECLHPEDRRPVLSGLENLAERGHLVHEYRFLHQDGSYRWIRDERLLSPPSGETGPVFIGHWVDITEQKKTEAALRWERDFTRTLIDASPAFFVALDPRGRILAMNKSLLSALDCSAREVEGADYLSTFVPAEDRRELSRNFRNLLRAKKKLIIENRIVSSNGREFLIEWHGRPIMKTDGGYDFFIGSGIDISERKRFEAALKNSEEKYRLLIENTHQIIIIIQDEKSVFITPNIEKLTGYTVEEFSAAPLEKFIHPEDLDSVAGYCRQPLGNESGPRFFEFRMLDREGRSRWVEANRAEINWDNKAALLFFLNDVTARKAAEEKARRQQDQLFQSAKMASLGTLVSGVAHEINNPLNLLLFNVPFLRELWTDLQPVLREQVQHLQDGPEIFGGLTLDQLDQTLEPLMEDMELAVNRVYKIVSGLKEFARKSIVTDQKPVSLNEAVENAVTLFGSSIKKYMVELELELDDSLPDITGHLQSLEQIVINLAMNGAQAIQHDFGKIVIKTGYRPEYDSVYLSVSDNGRGISRDFAGTLFDPFVTDKQDQGGTGLGLSITYSLVQAHGGRIAYSTQAGEGTTFTVLFPPADQNKKP